MMVLGLFFIVLTGCGSKIKGNIGKMSSFRVPSVEAMWIQNGEPIEFEDELWYPQDSFDILIDSEVSLLSEYREIQFFVHKIDVRPYNRLYTKFGRNRFRVFIKKQIDDKDKEPF